MYVSSYYSAGRALMDVFTNLLLHGPSHFDKHPVFVDKEPQVFTLLASLVQKYQY